MEAFIILLFMMISISYSQGSENQNMELQKKVVKLDVDDGIEQSYTSSYMIIGKSLVDSLCFIAYSEFDSDSTVLGVYLNSIDEKKVPVNIYEIFQNDEQIRNDSEFDLEDIASYNDKVVIEKINDISLNDNCIYLHIIVPEESDYHKHIFLKYKNKTFQKLFEIEAQEIIKLKVKNGFLLNTKYSIADPYSNHSDNYFIEYNFKLNKLKETKK